MRRLRVLVVVLAMGAGVAGALVVTEALAGSGSRTGPVGRLAAARHALLLQLATGQLRRATIRVHAAHDGKSVTFNRPLPLISGAVATSVQEAICPGNVVPNCDERARGADSSPNGSLGLDTGIAPQTLGCGRRESYGNKRVNQDCTYRRQAEEDITYNFSEPGNLVAGQNDSRVGYNQCGIDFSTDNGSTWGDMLPPFRQKLNSPQFDGQNSIGHDPGTLHTYDAASDPVNATDSSGRAFFACVMFDVASNASGVFGAESPVGAKGSFYYNIPPTGNGASAPFIADEENNGAFLDDKEWIAADHYVHSPNRDNVYLTWTLFKSAPQCAPPGSPDGTLGYCESPVYGSMSTDHGHTWSAPQEISGAAPICYQANAFNSSLPSDMCNFDQGSNPVALPNGDLEVVFNNGNTAPNNPNAQQLGVHCHPTGDSTNGTASLNCSQPVSVGQDYIVGEPQCDFGRGPEECVPGPYIRTNDFPRIQTENTQNNHLYVVWQDYRHGEYDIHMARSLDGGLHWSDAGQVNPDTGLDHYFPAVDQSPSLGDRLGVSYYRSQRVPGENTPPSGGGFQPCPGAAATNMATPSTTGCEPGVGNESSDYVLAGGTGDQTPYAFDVVSPAFPPPDGIQSGFNGDYSGITINRGVEAHPIWSDTRNANPYPANGVAHDEDVFTDSVGLPNGHGRTEAGRIGR